MRVTGLFLLTLFVLSLGCSFEAFKERRKEQRQEDRQRILQHEFHDYVCFTYMSSIFCLEKAVPSYKPIEAPPGHEGF